MQMMQTDVRGTGGRDESRRRGRRPTYLEQRAIAEARCTDAEVRHNDERGAF